VAVKYLSVCSGIEAATVAWHPLGWKPVGFCEIEPFPSAVLAHHHPKVPNYGDFTKLADPAHPVHIFGADLLVGGTPCQAFSVAGLRQGLADHRGGLTLEFLKLARTLRPRWVVWENVPGVLSQDGGRAFGAFLGGLEDLGYGWAYRVLDAQYVRVDGYPGAVPQRRQRVFVVAHSAGRFDRAAAVLFEPEGVHGHSAPCRKAGQGATGAVDIGFEVCGTISDGAHHGGGLNGQDAYSGRILPVAFDTGLQPVTYTAPSIGAFVQTDVAGTLVKHNVAGSGETQNAAFVQAKMAVRRLTPVECERLQGFPDNYTRIPWKRKPAEECADGGRYKALGNSMAVNCMRWIGRRIQLVEQA
jgi:DNA (cytosine-5)-methyltransferase 1